MKKAAITVLALLLAAALAGCGEKPAVSPVAPAAATTATLTATSETSVSVESVAPTPAVTPSAVAPSYSAAPHVQYGGSSSYENSDDPYNAKVYTGADDFYDDNYDDFDSYEDAETYWEDNAG